MVFSVLELLLPDTLETEDCVRGSGRRYVVAEMFATTSLARVVSILSLPYVVAMDDDRTTCLNTPRLSLVLSVLMFVR